MRFRLHFSGICCWLAVLLALVGPATAQTSTTEVAPGVRHEVYAAPGPNVVNVVRVERDRPELTLEMGFPHGRRNFPSRQTTTTIASLYHDPPEREVLAAVNGSFFGSGTDITGSLGTRSNLIQFPDTRSNWPTFVWTDAGEGHINSTANVSSVTLTFADGTTTPVDRFNQVRLGETIAFYTTDYAPTTGNTFQGTEVIVENATYPLRPNKEFSGVVTAVRTGADSLNNAIPQGGFVIAARDSKSDLLQEKVSVGDRLTVRAQVNDGRLNNATFMIDGAGWILSNGSTPEHLWTFSDNFLGRHPRTLLAYNDDYLFLVTIDGRQTASVGMSFSEMATFLSGTLGATDAVNLDGGGSTTMVVNGSLVNVPSDGSQRSVSNAVLLVRETAASPETLADSFPDGARTLPWDDKFTFNATRPIEPPGPGGASHAIEVLDPAGGLESVRIGTRRDTDRTVAADVFLDYRPNDAAQGYERYGLFLRDSGNGAFTNAFFRGNAYVMTFDSDTGRIRAGKVTNGSLTDFLEADQRFVTASGWHRFAIKAYENRIGFFLDDELLKVVTDDTYSHGVAGIGYREYFGGGALPRGARATNFSYTVAEEPPGDTMAASWMLH